MPRGLLVSIMACLAVKDHVQRDIELPVIHLSRQVRIQLTHGKKDYAGMIEKIFLTGADQCLDRLGRIITQSEVDIVRKHGDLQSGYPVLSGNGNLNHQGSRMQQPARGTLQNPATLRYDLKKPKPNTFTPV